MVQLKGFRNSVTLDDGSGLYISRPDLQDGMATEITPGELPVDFVNEYHAAFEVRCCFCSKKTPHYHGWTARMADGRLALCGIDCANRIDAPLVKELAGRLKVKMRVVAIRRSAREDIASALGLLLVVTEDLVELERVASALATELNQRLAHTSVVRTPGIKGIEIIRKPRLLHLRQVRTKLLQWREASIDEWTEDQMLAATREAGRMRAALEAGLAFLASAADLFSEDGIRALAQACRSNYEAPCRPVWVKEPGGTHTVQIIFGNIFSPPKSFRLGSFGIVPDLEQVLAIFDGKAQDVDASGSTA